jgi:hypothetical protein
MKRTVRSNSGEVTVRETGLVYARAFPNTIIDLDEAKAYHAMVDHLSKHNAHCTVIDISGIKSISTEARKFLQETSSKWNKTLAVALVTTSFTSKMIGTFFLTVNRPTYPIKIFSDTREAYAWARNEYSKAMTKMAS